MRPSEAERALFELAEQQGGYFTAKQAAHLGYTASKRNYHVETGNWIREHRGIFRLGLFPLPERPDLLKWWLWSRGRDDQPRGVFSHQTALSLHELTDVNPAKIDLAVPTSFRKGAPIPPVLALHFEDIPEREQENIHGVPVTKALRTILDVWPTGAVPQPQLKQAFVESRRSGKITMSELTVARKERETASILMQLERGNA